MRLHKADRNNQFIKALECSMTESEFLVLADATLGEIEAAFERAGEDADVDIECSRSGNVLEIEFVDNGAKIIVNSQAPMQEMWIASRTGGFHYKREGSIWKNTRDGSELFAALSHVAAELAAKPMALKQG
jgi:CyaY protein